MSEQSARNANVRPFAQDSQERLLTEVVDAILRDVLQGKKPHLRDHMLNVAAKVSRRHPWPFFEEVVSAEVDRRIGGGDTREWFHAALDERRASRACSWCGEVVPGTCLCDDADRDHEEAS